MPLAFNLFWIGSVVVLLVFLFFLVTFFQYVSLWIRARMSGVPLSFFQLVFMSMRKVDPRVVVDALILARQSGIDLSHEEVQRAYLRGVDVEKVVLAMIEAERQGRNFEFQDIVEAELHNRLQEKLDGEE